MAETSNQALLKEVVKKNSFNSNNWILAKKEWELVTIFDSNAKCVCDHLIVENCEIKNKINGNVLIVGNACINHFQEPKLNVPKAARDSLKKLIQDTNNSKASIDLLDVCVLTGLISSDCKFEYINITTAKKTDDNDYEKVKAKKKISVNKQIALAFSANRPKCFCPENPYARPRINGIIGACYYSCAEYPNGCKFTKNV